MTTPMDHGDLDKKRGLTKVAVNLTPEAMDAMYFIAAMDGSTRTWAINNALTRWAQVVAVQNAGRTAFAVVNGESQVWWRRLLLRLARLGTTRDNQNTHGPQ